MDRQQLESALMKWVHLIEMSIPRTLKNTNSSPGHILGLNHEHQRPDADQYVTVKCDQIPGFDRMQEYLNNNHPLWPVGSVFAGAPIIIQDMCHYGELSLRPVFASLWRGGSYIPKRLNPATNKDYLGNSEMYTSLGRFDRLSVTLYGSENNFNCITWSDGTPIRGRSMVWGSPAHHISSQSLNHITDFPPRPI